MTNKTDMSRPARVAAFVAMALGLASSAAAQTLLLDFGATSTFRGLDVSNPDSNGNYWTSIPTGVFLENLVDINNVPTTIDFGFSTGVGTDSFNGPAGVTDASTVDSDVFLTDVDFDALGLLGGAIEASFDFVSGGGTPDLFLRFEIQGLSPSSTYDLTFFGSHKYSYDPTTVYSVYSDNTYTTLVDSVTLDVQDLADPSLHNRDKVATISGVSPQENDILYIQVLGSPAGAFGYLNSMMIVGSAAPVGPGDFNGDGLVDAADYTVWRDNLNGDEAALGGGGDGSGTVDNGDYAYWTANYGTGSAAIGIPEPATVLATAIGMFAAVAASKRQR